MLLILQLVCYLSSNACILDIAMIQNRVLGYVVACLRQNAIVHRMDSIGYRIFLSPYLFVSNFANHTPSPFNAATAWIHFHVADLSFFIY